VRALLLQKYLNSSKLLFSLLLFPDFADSIHKAAPPSFPKFVVIAIVLIAGRYSRFMLHSCLTFAIRAFATLPCSFSGFFCYLVSPSNSELPPSWILYFAISLQDYNLEVTLVYSQQLHASCLALHILSEKF
jgi:hypothetical protein